MAVGIEVRTEHFRFRWSVGFFAESLGMPFVSAIEQAMKKFVLEYKEPFEGYFNEDGMLLGPVEYLTEEQITDWYWPFTAQEEAAGEREYRHVGHKPYVPQLQVHQLVEQPVDELTQAERNAMTELCLCFTDEESEDILDDVISTLQELGVPEHTLLQALQKMAADRPWYEPPIT